MKKNIIIKSISHDGKGIGYIDNKIIFVPKTINGEVVDAKVIKDKKNYLEGKLVSVVKKTDKRTESLCPYYDKCGGCAYLHIDKNYEEEIKTNAVIDIFKKYSNLDISPKFISLNEYNYRNKIELKIKMAEELKHSNTEFQMASNVVTLDNLNEVDEKFFRKTTHKGKLFKGPNWTAYNKENLGSIPRTVEKALVEDKKGMTKVGLTKLFAEIKGELEL